MVTELSTISSNEWTRERVELVKRTFCKGATDDELSLFISTCKRLGLSPEARQIFAVKRYDSQEKKMVMSIQQSIDGFRLVAERTGDYEGQTEAQWCGDDGVWKDCWLSSQPPKAARVGVLKKGFKSPLFSTAHWDEFVQLTKEGHPTAMWRKMPRLMLAKCAEATALRKAFPNELSGNYTTDEMGQSENLISEKILHSEVKPIQEAIEPTPILSYEIFNFQNMRHVAKLETELNKRKINHKYWTQIAEKLEGKEFKAENLNLICKEIISQEQVIDDILVEKDESYDPT